MMEQMGNDGGRRTTHREQLIAAVQMGRGSGLSAHRSCHQRNRPHAEPQAAPHSSQCSHHRLQPESGASGRHDGRNSSPLGTPRRRRGQLPRMRGSTNRQNRAAPPGSRQHSRSGTLWCNRTHRTSTALLRDGTAYRHLHGRLLTLPQPCRRTWSTASNDRPAVRRSQAQGSRDGLPNRTPRQIRRRRNQFRPGTGVSVARPYRPVRIRRIRPLASSWAPYQRCSTVASAHPLCDHSLHPTAPL